MTHQVSITTSRGHSLSFTDFNLNACKPIVRHAHWNTANRVLWTHIPDHDDIVFYQDEKCAEASKIYKSDGSASGSYNLPDRKPIRAFKMTGHVSEIAQVSIKTTRGDLLSFTDFKPDVCKSIVHHDKWNTAKGVLWTHIPNHDDIVFYQDEKCAGASKIYKSDGSTSSSYTLPDMKPIRAFKMTVHSLESTTLFESNATHWDASSTSGPVADDAISANWYEPLPTVEAN
ncbi:hypothetical protein BBJ28_00014179 [Nothophytophthora sp. Chile5]|nr:hypothetical protein BBJ28_00014179 [Nothophytophthora sp. Chile5]